MVLCVVIVCSSGDKMKCVVEIDGGDDGDGDGNGDGDGEDEMLEVVVTCWW